MPFDPMQYMLQRQQQAMAPLANPYAGLAENFGAMLQTQDQLQRQRLLDEHQQQAWKREADAAQRKAKEEQYKVGYDRFKDLAQSGDIAGSKAAYNGLVPLEQELYPSLNSQPLVGGMRMLDPGTANAQGQRMLDPSGDLANMSLDQIRQSYTLGPQGQGQFKVQDEKNPLTHQRIMGLAGIKPEYKGYSQQEDVLSFLPGQAPTVVRRGTPKPSTAVTYGAPEVDPITGRQIQRASNGRVVGVGGQSAGGKDWAQINNDFTSYLTNRYGLKFGADSGYRPAGTVQGETGVHATSVARDVPADPNTPLGQQIMADAKAAGFYTYTKPHGTGPHIHIEFNRNPDGSMKSGAGGKSGKGSGSTGGQPKPQDVNAALETVNKMRTAAANRHKNSKKNTDWAKADAEWRPKAEAYLKRYNLNLSDYFPQDASVTQYPGMPLAPGFNADNLPPQQPATRRDAAVSGAREALLNAKRGGFVK